MKLVGNHKFITLTIDGSEALNFVFDSGAGNTSVNTRVAEKLNLISTRKKTTSGAAGKVQLSVIKNNTLNIHGLVLKKIDLQSASLVHLEKVIGERIDGIIGYDILKKYVVKINYNTSIIEVQPPKGFKYNGNGEKIKISLGKLPVISTIIHTENKKDIEAEFVLDTGAGLPIAFCTPFAKEHQLQQSFPKTYTIKSRGFTSHITTVIKGRLKQLNIKEFEFTKIPVSVYNTESGFFANKKVAGVIGNEILKRFNITFDYKRKTSYWEVNNLNKTPFKVSHSGISLIMDKTLSLVFIDNIIPASPAALSKLKIGDEIIEIDGIKTSSTSLVKLEELLKQKDKKIEIKYKRNDVVDSITIQLRAMI